MFARFLHLGFALSLALCGLACSSTGGRRAFLIFGAPAEPHGALVHSVERAEDELQEASDDFAEAMRLFAELTAPQALNLEALSDDFSDAVKACGKRSRELDDRIAAVQEESDELFGGWSAELQEFALDSLRKKSEAMMLETKGRTDRVTHALEGTRARMSPVLKKLCDYALFFHHNLNARAIATLQDTYGDFDAEFAALRGELDRTRVEIRAYLASFESAPAQESQHK
jgi:hypothetical protein